MTWNNYLYDQYKNFRIHGRDNFDPMYRKNFSA